MTTDKPVSHARACYLAGESRKYMLSDAEALELLSYISQRESAEREVARIRADFDGLAAALSAGGWSGPLTSLLRVRLEQARQEGYEKGRAEGSSLLRPAVKPPPLPDDPAERAAVLARGAAVHRSLKEPCTVHRFNSLGHCEKCGGRRDPV